MKSLQQLSTGTVNLNVRDHIARCSLAAAGALLIFDREISAPIGRPCQSLAYHGCARAFEVAMSFLSKPNVLAISVLAEMKAIDQECTKIYEDNSLRDDYERDMRSFSSHPSWKALCAIGNYADDECEAERAAIGVNIGLAWLSIKKMATGYMQRIVGMSRELALYKKHCEALYARLERMQFSGVVMQWLRDVIAAKDVVLLATIDQNGGIDAVSTKDVVNAVSPNSKLAKDFGRKFTENALRLAGYSEIEDSSPSEEIPLRSKSQVDIGGTAICLGCRTEDVDQGLRHEAAGRETTTTISDSCERTWAKRMAPVMDRSTSAVFKQNLFGLRKK